MLGLGHYSDIVYWFRFFQNGTGGCLVSKGLPKGLIKLNRGQAEILNNKAKYSSLDSYIIVNTFEGEIYYS